MSRGVALEDASTPNSDELHRATLENIADAVFLTDDRGRFRYVCPNVNVIFGYTPDEIGAFDRVNTLLGENLFDSHELARRGELRNIEREVTIRSGERRTVLIHVKAVSIQGGTVLYCCRDVTELRHAEEEIRALRAELIHVARLALAGQLMASIAHEVKQPLTAIVGNAAAAARALESAPDRAHAGELREILGDIVAEARLAADIVDRLRLLSRKRPLSLVLVDLNTAVTETLRFIQSDARRRHVALLAELEPGLPTVRADRVCMQQVLLSLSFNAIDAMEHTPPRERRILFRTRRTRGQVELLVSDAGSGIPEPVLDRLFEPFFTTKTRGLGLGLPITQSIVDAHRGRIWATNNAEAGATFHVALPTSERRL